MRPSQVTLAVRLIVATFALGLIRMPMDFAPNLFLLLVAAPTLLITSFLTYMVWIGRNWARLVFAALLILGLPFSIFPIWEALHSRPLSGYLGLVQIVLQLASLLLIFQPASRPWFHR